MARLGSELQLQVQKLVLALGGITRTERERRLERVKQDCGRVREDVSQTLGIQHYLASLLAEADPFLLIWVRTAAAVHPSQLELVYPWGWLMTRPVALFSGLSVRRHQVSPQRFCDGDGVIQGLHLWGLTMTV